MSLRRVSVRVPSVRGEDARAVMLELFPDGFEEAEAGAELELRAYTDAAGEEQLRRAFGATSAERVERGWEDAWKRFHRPVRVGPLWIGPPWKQPDADAVAVVIDPGRAFGTGAHPTTRLCLEFLLGRPRASVVDLGCGSGVIAIAAAKLGFAPVIALDADEVAVAATRENARRNAVAIEVSACDVLATPIPAAELAVANIALRDVEAVADRAPVRWLITSGYEARSGPSLRGWVHVERRERAGWAADLFEARGRGGRSSASTMRRRGDVRG